MKSLTIPEYDDVPLDDDAEPADAGIEHVAPEDNRDR